jgi:hypothetical protein
VTAASSSNGGGAVNEAGSSLYERAVDRVLAIPDRVTTAEQGKALLASDRRVEALTDKLQKALVVAVPVLRTLSKGSRFSGMPWALVASTTISIGVTVRAGVREVQVLRALVADRVERETGGPADGTLVKKLAVELYLDPGSEPDLSDRRPRYGNVVTRWLFRGMVGRDTRKTATKALEAAEELDVQPLVARWSDPAVTSAPRVANGH